MTVGVGAHSVFHVVAVIDPSGTPPGRRVVPTTPAGHQALIAWTATHETVTVGVEATGAYGAGLTRALEVADVAVVAVDRSDRKARRDQGKSNPPDAYAAARAAASVGPPASRRRGPVTSSRSGRHG